MQNRLSQFAFLFTLSTAACLAQTGPSPAGALRAGAAMVDITPKPSELPIKTDSIRDPLFVRAIVVASGSTCAAIIAMDQGATRLDLYNDAVPRIVAATGCPKENILISATHTHSGSTNGLGGLPNSKTLADAVVKAATDAKAKLAPATIGYGRTTVDLNVNRDLFNSKLEWRQEPNPQGVSDKTLSVVEFIGRTSFPLRCT